MKGEEKEKNKGRKKEEKKQAGKKFKEKLIVFIRSESLHFTREHFNDVLVSHQLDPPSNLPLNIASAPMNNHPCS